DLSGASSRRSKSPVDTAFEIPRLDEITSPFGVRRVFNKVLQSQHRGLDIDGRIGTEIRAANDGVVVLAARNFFYVGNAVFLHHGQQLYSMYFHLSTLDVDTGDRVKRGQLIGAVGRTGRVTGPHLHFSVKLRGFYIDPVDVMAYRPAPMEAPLQVEGRRIVKRLGRR
ncbi:MAG: M23 family metallopeptidase, partial [Myxococcota bacterium]